MITVKPTTLELNGVRLEPMDKAHAKDLSQAARDGELWNIRVSSVPEPGAELAYVESALEMQKTGYRLPFIVRESSCGKIIGTTSYHDILPDMDRLEIGYTWYAKSWQRTHVNTSCKLALMAHAFDTLGCKAVGFRTDNLNYTSQKAIERLGAKRDGIFRHYSMRRDGTIRDAVIYSILAAEWPEIKARLLNQISKYSTP